MTNRRSVYPMDVWLLISVATLVAGCTKTNIQQCGDDGDCDYRPGGACTVNSATGNQWCAFEDSTCPGGSRWGDITVGDDLGGTCVAIGGQDAAMIDGPQPCVAPDRLAFFEGSPNGMDLWAADPDGLNAVNLTNTPAGEAEASDSLAAVWSPVEDRLAFSKRIDANNGEVWVANGDGSSGYALARDFLDFAPSWSADGLRIAFTRQDGQLSPSNVWWWLASGVSGQAVTTSDGAFYPAWSPDGSKIAFYKGNEIYVIDPGGSNEVPVTTGSAASNVQLAAEWSPDGSRLLFISRGSGNTDVWVVDGNGDNLVNVTRTSGPETSAHWFPDGERIIYSVRTATAGDEIHVALADGSSDAPLVSGGSDRDATVSPDGARIAWSSARDGNREIYVGDSDGSSPMRITTTAGDDHKPVWRPCR